LSLSRRNAASESEKNAGRKIMPHEPYNVLPTGHGGPPFRTAPADAPIGAFVFDEPLIT
jgi:hypothetical protein